LRSDLFVFGNSAVRAAPAGLPVWNSENRLSVIMKKFLLYGTAALIGVVLAVYSHHTPPIQDLELRALITQLLI